MKHTVWDTVAKMVAMVSVFLSIFALVSCVRQGGGSVSIAASSQETSVIPAGGVANSANAQPITTPNSNQLTVNVYIENSGSMNGFINKASEFQDAIQKMMVLLKYYYKQSNIKLNYINTAVYPQQVSANKPIEDFAVDMLNPEKFRRVGAVHSTDLNDIVKLVLNGVDENSISILISDCIYSITGTASTKTLLCDCKNKTMGAFLAKTDEYPNLATTIVRLVSNFDGFYWDYQHPSGNIRHSLNCTRPYYMCIIGTEENVSLFNKNICVEKMKGYENKYVLTSSMFLDSEYSALIRTDCRAMFRVNGRSPYRALDRARAHGGVFQFAIGANLSEIPLSDIEKVNPKSYRITQGNNYKIVSVAKIDTTQMHFSDKEIVRNNHLTHEIVVKTEQPFDVEIGVLRGIPDWVTSNSSEDDTMIDTDPDEWGKTFGLKYFVKGISEAYQVITADSTYYTKYRIKITQ